MISQNNYTQKELVYNPSHIYFGTLQYLRTGQIRHK